MNDTTNLAEQPEKPTTELLHEALSNHAVKLAEACSVLLLMRNEAEATPGCNGLADPATVVYDQVQRVNEAISDIATRLENSGGAS